MGFDHQEIGEKILSKWTFPQILKNIVRYHHEPELAVPGGCIGERGASGRARVGRSP